MPTKKKKRYNARFPPARIKKIMQSDEDVGKVAAAVPVIISRALELFVETLMTNVNASLTQRGARTMTPGHLKMCIQSEPRFDFLKELVADVAEPQQGDSVDVGDSDNCQAMASNSFVMPLNLSSSVTSTEADSSVPAAGPRLQRQISGSRLRTRLRRKNSQDASKPKTTSAAAAAKQKRGFVDSEEEEEEVDEEDENDDLMLHEQEHTNHPHHSSSTYSRSFSSSSHQVSSSSQPPQEIFSTSPLGRLHSVQHQLLQQPLKTERTNQQEQHYGFNFSLGNNGTSPNFIITPLASLSTGPPTKTQTSHTSIPSRVDAFNKSSTAATNGCKNGSNNNPFAMSTTVKVKNKNGKKGSSPAAAVHTLVQSGDHSHLDVDEDYDA